MRVVDFFAGMLKGLVGLLVAISRALHSVSTSPTVPGHMKSVVPPAAWQAQVEALDQRLRQPADEMDALEVADALQLAVQLFDEIEGLYRAVSAKDAGADEAVIEPLRFILSVLFQTYLREGSKNTFGTILALLVVLDRRLSESTSDATFTERLVRWLGATGRLVADSEGGQEGVDTAELVAACLQGGLVFGSMFFHWLVYKDVPWLTNVPEEWRPVFRLGLDDLESDRPASQRRALQRALTMYYPPKRAAFLNAETFQQLRPLPRPWVAGGPSITVLPVPAQAGVHGGAVGLYIEGDVSTKLEDVEGGRLFEVEAEPGLSVLIPVGSPEVPNAPPVGAGARVAFVQRLQREGKTDPSGATLELEELRFEARLEAPAAVPAATVIMALRGLELSLGGLVPLRGKCDLRVRYDTRTQRIEFEGGLGLELRKRFALGNVEDADDKPTGNPVAEATLLARVALQSKAEGFTAGVDLLVDATLRLSRFATLSVAGTGLHFDAHSVPSGGRLFGIFDADLKGVPPTGIGLAVAIGPVTGGGMLRVTETRVSGVVELALGKRLRLSGIGQFDSRSRWLVLVSIERPGPGPMFMPKGIGVLVARGRQADQQAMLASLGSGEIDSVLMPRDVVANESRIMTALDRFFPPGDATVVALMARWESAKGEFTAKVGVMLELPHREDGELELHLIAIATLKVPGQERWTLEGVGFLNLDRKEGYLKLKLTEARLWGTEFTGSALIFHGDPDGDGPVGKGTWLSLGGFFPGYALPGPAMQGMTRIGVSIKRGDHVNAFIAGYLAWTPASMQVGLRAELHAHYFGFGFDGGLGFDALIGFDGSAEIRFDAELTFSVAGRTLCGFDIEAVYTSTDRECLSGKAHYEFLCFSGTKHFNCPLGERDSPRLPVSELEEALAAELASVAAWRAPVAAGVVLVARDRGITIGPDGRTYFEQSIVPLNVEIDLFGMQRLATPKVLRIDVAPLGSLALQTKVRVGEFAPGLFFEMTQQEALRAPVSVSHDAGFEIELPLAGGAARAVEDDWEDVVVDPAYVPPDPSPTQPRRHLLAVQLEAMQNRLMADGEVREARPVEVKPLVFTGADAQPLTWMHARRAMQRTPPAVATPLPGVMLARAPLEAAFREAVVPPLEVWR